jgi:hypothetical protein
LQTTATNAYNDGSAVYYFPFGTHNYTGFNAVYQLEEGPAHLLTRNTHFVQFNGRCPMR